MSSYLRDLGIHFFVTIKLSFSCMLTDRRYQFILQASQRAPPSVKCVFCSESECRSGRSWLCPESCKTQDHRKTQHGSCSSLQTLEVSMKTAPSEREPFSLFRLDNPVAAHSFMVACFPLLPQKVIIFKTDWELHQLRNAIWLNMVSFSWEEQNCHYCSIYAFLQSVELLMEQQPRSLCI